MAHTSWRPRLALPDVVAWLAVAGLSLVVAAPVGAHIGWLVAPSDSDALASLGARLGRSEAAPISQPRPLVQFLPGLHITGSPPVSPHTTPKTKPGATRVARKPLQPPVAALPTGSTVVADTVGDSRLTLFRPRNAGDDRFRASLAALQRLVQRPTLRWDGAPVSVNEQPVARLPPSTGRESWQASRDLVFDGHLPHPQLVRTESFVQAVSDAWPNTDAAPWVRLLPDSRADNVWWVQVGAASPAGQADTREPVDVVFMVDTSGSMNLGGGLDEVRAALIAAVQSLGPRDRAAVVAYNGSPHVVVPLSQNIATDELIRKLAELTADGATDAASGVAYARSLLQKRRWVKRGRPQHIVLFSDGDLMASGEATWSTAAAEVAEAGVTLTTIAMGQTWADAGPLEARLASVGGHHLAARDGQEAARGVSVALGQSRAAAPAPDLEVRFVSPAVVSWEWMGWSTDAPVVGEAADRQAAGTAAVGLLRVTTSKGGVTPVGTVSARYTGAQRVSTPLDARAQVSPGEAPGLRVAIDAARLAERLRALDAPGIEAVAEDLARHQRPDHPEDVVLTRVARRAAHLAQVPLVDVDAHPALAASLPPLVTRLGDDCFADLTARRGERHGQLTAQLRFHRGQLTKAEVLDDQLDDRMVEACVLRRLQLWTPPPGLEGDLVLPLVWGPAGERVRDGT